MKSSPPMIVSWIGVGAAARGASAALLALP
jgi:hypothetical protein